MTNEPILNAKFIPPAPPRHFVNEQEKLARYFYEWQHNKNPVTRASYRNMALSLYFELYIF
jgi:hypothetical protein